MGNKTSIPELGEDYIEHPVFEHLTELYDFYDSLSFTTTGSVSRGTLSILNLDTHVFTSISGTIDSIKGILFKGRINDAYALLRKYYDSTIINVYTNLYLEDKFDFDTYIVQQIEDWITGKQTIPEYRIISKYIKDCARLEPITTILKKDGLYKNVRNRCNDHTHYNYYKNIIINDNQLYVKGRPKILDGFSKDLIAIFIQHFAYLFYLKEHYMGSTDYVDALTIGIEPEENSQYWVAPFIQDAFDKIIKPNRPDIAEEIKSKVCMDIK